MSGVSQAAYHGVPVAALPFFGDQPGNAAQAVARVRDISTTPRNPNSTLQMLLLSALLLSMHSVVAWATPQRARAADYRLNRL